jgi:primosomal protein N' (replication factor Y)
MYVVTAIPLAFIPRPREQAFTYFFHEAPPARSLVEVPFAKRMLPALVLEVKRLDEKKISIKRASYRLKPLSRILTSSSVLSRSELALAQWISEYYYEPLSFVLKSLLPARVQDKASTGYESTEAVKSRGFSFIHSSSPLRSVEYLDAIQRNVERDAQTLVLFPDVRSAEKFFERLPTPLKSIALLWTSQRSPRKELEAVRKVSTNQTKIVIGARGAVLVSLPWLSTVVLEGGESDAYKSWDRHPKYDARGVALHLARERSAELMWGSSFSSTRLLYLVRQLSKRNEVVVRENKEEGRARLAMTVIDMREELGTGNKSPVSRVLRNSLARVLDSGGSAVLFMDRRGEHTVILCRDCGYVLACPRCSASLITVRTREGSRFFCRYCGTFHAAPSTCPRCAGTRFKLFGAGTQRIAEELSVLFPRARVALLDKDSAPTPELQEKVIADFENGNIDVLVGTQMLEKLSRARATLSAIVSAETSLFLPEYNGEEKVFLIASRLRAMAEEEFLWQTYDPEQRVVKALLSSHQEEFWNEELALRKKFLWPPYVQLVKASISLKDRVKGEKEAASLHALLARDIPEGIQVYSPLPSRIEKVRGKYAWHILIKVSRRMALSVRNEFLSRIPSHWEIDVDPAHTLE